MCDPTAMSLDEYIQMNQIRPRFRGQRDGFSGRGGRSGRGWRGRGRGWDRNRSNGNQQQYQDEEDDDESDEEETEQRWRGRRNFQGRGNWQQGPDRRNWRPRNWRFDREDDSSDEGPEIQEEGEGKLFVHNLHPEVMINDLKELFAALGPLKALNVHYDRLGRSLGSADIMYEKKMDAVKAIKEYNGVPLDGKEMKICLLKGSSELGVPKLGLQRLNAKRRYMID